MKGDILELDACCAYCEHAAILHNEDHVLCEKHGVVRSAFVCRRFAYDPLKRVPGRNAAPKLEYVDIDSIGKDGDQSDNRA